MTNKHTLSNAFQALTDLEIVNDEYDFPVAVITVPGMHKLKISMLSEWDYFYVLSPMRESFLNYCLNKFATDEEKDEKKLVERVKALVDDIRQCKTENDINKRSTALEYIFEDIKIRYSFFKALKKMKIIKWWVSWKRYQKCMRPIDSMTVFIYLWLFNFDGVKKNAKLLFQKIGAITKSHQSITSTSSIDWHSWKKRQIEIDKRLRVSLNN
jgi:hypothetical protein